MFTLNGKSFGYFDHAYNSTKLNERRVEVAVALELHRKGRNVLEVGAVLPHYLSSWKHACIDLYEQYPGVLNANVLEHEPAEKYDLILCVSTLDHLRSMGEVAMAVDRMRSWLLPQGLLFCTVPYGQFFCPWIDLMAISNSLGFTANWRMDKVKGEWAQVSHSEEPRGYNQGAICASTVYFLLDGPIKEWW